MVDVAVIMGADPDRAWTQLNETLQFEIALANVRSSIVCLVNFWIYFCSYFSAQLTLPLEKQRNFTELYNPMTIKQIQETYPYIDWIDYIVRILPEDLVIDENELINVRVPSFFKGLGELLQTTPKETLANYLFWRVVETTSYYLNDQLRLRKFAFASYFSGRKEFNSWWSYCTEATNEK